MHWLFAGIILLVIYYVFPDWVVAFNINLVEYGILSLDGVDRSINVMMAVLFVMGCVSITRFLLPLAVSLMGNYYRRLIGKN